VIDIPSPGLNLVIDPRSARCASVDPYLCGSILFPHLADCISLDVVDNVGTISDGISCNVYTIDPCVLVENVLNDHAARGRWRPRHRHWLHYAI
jgi:hypothetical protein